MILEFIKLGVVGLVAGLFTAFIANKNFRKQQWWERRADAYSNLISSLSDLLEYYGVLMDLEEHRIEVTDERMHELSESWSAAYRHVRRSNDMGSFLYSGDVQSALAELIKTHDKKFDSIFKHAAEHYSAVEDCLCTVVGSSKEDLDLMSFYHPLFSWFARKFKRTK